RLESVDLFVIVRQAIEAASFGIHSRAQALRVELPDEPVVVTGDAIRLEQIVTNLLGNAVKYTPAAGRIDLRLSTADETAVLKVSDSGMGIEPELLDKIFELFTQGDVTRARAAGGLGIGLTIARALVELHGGTITARSAGRDRGATFEVRLPRRQAPASAPPVAGLFALTGYGYAEPHRRAVEAGFDQHLVKPGDPNVLARLIGAA